MGFTVADEGTGVAGTGGSEIITIVGDTVYAVRACVGTMVLSGATTSSVPEGLSVGTTVFGVGAALVPLGITSVPSLAMITAKTEEPLGAEVDCSSSL